MTNRNMQPDPNERAAAGARYVVRPFVEDHAEARITSYASEADVPEDATHAYAVYWRTEQGFIDWTCDCGVSRETADAIADALNSMDAIREQVRRAEHGQLTHAEFRSRVAALANTDPLPESERA